MTATMTNMELRFADYLFPNQLMEEDLIEVEDNLLTVVSINETKEGYQLILSDDFGDETELFLTEDDKVKWYVFVDTE